MDDAALMATWRMMRGDREIFAIPRVAFLRSIMLNHWYHHRGQLTVYLRELGVADPVDLRPERGREPVRLTPEPINLTRSVPARVQTRRT